MFFRQLYDQPLAQASYLIGCQATGEAIVVDPLRDIAPYVDLARSEGLRITHVTETHIHADFVSGARELAAATGAQLYVSGEGGADWQYRFARHQGAPVPGITIVHDGDVISVGNLRLEVMHTPGHTPEHIAFVLTDTPRAAGPMGVLTGDFVFVGDVGRPDLLERAAGIANTMEAGAHTLFHSLQRFRALPDHLQVWPAHGAGSACGKALGAVPSSTVGYEKLANWGVAETDEAQFVASVLDGQPEPPRYFAEMKRINRDGPAILGGMPSPPRLEADRVVDLSARTWLIDVRPSATFAAGFIPSALSMPYSRSFSTWMGSLVPYSADLVFLVPSAEHETHPAVVQNAARDLALIGLDRVIGWIDADDAAHAWRATGRALDTIPQVTVDALAQTLQDGATLVDVRGETEWRAGHIPQATHIPLGALDGAAASLPESALLMQCQSGARSAIAASLLKRLGKPHVRNLVGGYSGWVSSR